MEHVGFVEKVSLEENTRTFVWDFRRLVVQGNQTTINNLTKIGCCNQNPFNGYAHMRNINAILIDPLRLVIVNNGNHSVNSAVIHNEGEIME